MRNRLRQLFQNRTVFTIVSTILGVGLAALLLTDPLRLAVGGSLLVLVIGGYLLYAAFFPKITRGMAQPGLARWLAAIFGLAGVLFALAMLVHVFRGGVPTRQQAQRQIAQERIARAAQGYTTWLDLSDLELREVPPDVWDLDHLIGLDLSRNRLESLSPEIENLADLEHLALGHNRLETLPPEMARLQQLTHLELEHNRLTEFPNVILELSNLEWLFLSGNQMGDLPPSITQRAEAGTLKLSYKPNASRFDWASAWVIFFTFVLPLVSSLGVNRWWTARERAQQQAARQEGTVFPIPPLFRSPTLFAVFGLSVVSLLMLASGINESRTNVTLETGVGLTLLFAPLILGGLLFVLRNTGLVVLTAEGVELRRPGRRHFLHYSDITALQSRANPFTAALLIHSAGRALRIPRTVENLPRLYELLLSRVAPAVRDAALGRTAVSNAAATTDGLVYTLGVRRRVWALYIAGTVLFVLLYLGLGLMGLWIGLAQGDAPPFTGEWLLPTVIFFLMISVFFLPALIFVIRSLLTRYGPFKIEQPVAWEFYRDKIRYRFPRSGWYERPARDLERVTLEPLPFRARARYGGALVLQRVMRYIVVLEFTGDTRLVIGQERAAQFGESLERLRATIRELYGR